eukprot:NODE_290_length_11632_cov_0.441256.p5 type:complete len:378 gc:universal NODE_290_length_11632_cov_0.441256:9111-10244(+)
MRLLSKRISKHSDGAMHLIPEDAEDIWVIYNVVVSGDRIRSTTFRKIQNESSTGSIKSEKKRITLSVTVQETTYDGYANVVHIKGLVCEESKFVKMNQSHTLDIVLNQKFWVSKDDWDIINLRRIEESCDITKKAEVGAIVFQEGLAHICLITSTITIPLQKIEATVSKKRIGSSQHKHSLDKFLKNVLEAMLRHFRFDKLQAVILASPGFVKDTLYQMIMKHAVTENDKDLLEFKDKFLILHGSSGHFQSLQDLLVNPAVQEKLKATKCLQQIREMQRFYDILGKDSGKAWYGYDHVQRALNSGAIETLLVSDELFRSPDVKIRNRYIRLTEDVEQVGGKVYIISTMHVTGEQLRDLTGVAAILMFPLEELENEED